METTSQTPRTDEECGGPPKSGDDTWPSMYVTADFARQLETELNEANERASSAEFQLNQEKNLNRDHEQDYLAVWKLIKRLDETVVQAAQRVSGELAEARNQLYRICKDGFDMQDTIGLEPADDYVLRQIAKMRDAIKGAHDSLEGMMNHYIRLIESGDAGNWNPHGEPEVIAAKAALAKLQPFIKP